MAETRCKYYKQKKQVSYDGVTWQDVIPYEYQKGALYEQQSQDCGYVPPVTQYRWVRTEDTTCIESGPEPPTPTGKKLVAQYWGGATREVQCNGDDTLRTGETRPYNWDFSGMTSAVIGNCVKNIDNMAFYYYFYEFSGLPHLRWVTIPNSVTTIGNSAFSHCYKLISAPIPDSVTEIGSSAFNKCKKLESINIPSGITRIGNYAFSGCGNAGGSIVIPDSLTSLGSNAFAGCSSLTSATFGNGITSIPNGVFYGCSGLTSVVIPDSVTSIGEAAFRGCRLTSLTIPNSVTTIDNYAFFSSIYLQSLTIPNSVRTIGNYAFANSLLGFELLNVVIPDSVVSIGKGAFSNHNNLTSVTCLAITPPTLGSDAFLKNASGRNIYVPSQSVSAYKSASGWSEYASRIQPIP